MKVSSSESVMAGTAMEPTDGADARFESLYREHHAEILAYFIRRIPRSDAEDAAARVFTVAWRRLADIPESDRALAWLFGVARRVLSNHRRGWHRRIRLSDRIQGHVSRHVDSPEVLVVRSEEDQMLIEALERLRLSDREILKLATWEKLSHAAIGELLEISEDAVAQRLHRARQRLAKELDRLENRQLLSVRLLSRKES